MSPAGRIHLVYPHGDRVSTPDAIGREVGRRLESRYEVVYYNWYERRAIAPEPGDVLLGHPHPDPGTVFRLSVKASGWRRKLLMAPFLHGDLRPVAFEDGLVRHCDLYLAITGPYWFRTIDQSPCSHWGPKMVHLDLAVDRASYPLLKTGFGPAGKRRVVYIGHTAWYKNTPYLSKIAALVPEAEFAWIGGAGRIRGLATVGQADFGSEAGRALISGYDFLLTVGSADPNPTTILEAMAWGLIPICTPTSGYEGIPSIVNVPLGDARSAASIVRRLIGADESELAVMQAANLQLLDEHYNWDRFAAQVEEAIESTASPALLHESTARRALFIYSDLVSPHGAPRRLVARIRRLWDRARARFAGWHRARAEDAGRRPG